MSASTLWVLVPVLNEAAQVPGAVAYCRVLGLEIPSAFSGRVRWVFCDSGSSDGTPDLLRTSLQFSGLDSTVEVVEAKLEKPSIARAINAAILQIGAQDYFLVHPIDCRLERSGFVELLEKVLGSGWGSPIAAVFPKRYTNRSRLLSLYAAAMNLVLLRWFTLWAWTNLICVRRDLLSGEGLDAPGFLEDLILSRRIRESGVTKHIFFAQVLVSSRRYDSEGPMQRIARNGWITFLFVSGLSSIDRLKRLYFRR